MATAKLEALWESAQEQIETATVNITEIVKQRPATTQPTEPSQPSPHSYATATGRSLSIHEREALARDETRARQILIDIEKNVDAPKDLHELDEATLVAKANQTLELMLTARERGAGTGRKEKRR